MAIEHFAWRIKASSQPTLKSKDTVRTAQFGDGYKQVSGTGLNDETLNYEFSFTGEPGTVKDIYAFLRRHKTKSFSFTPPEAVILRCGALRQTACSASPKVKRRKPYQPPLNRRLHHELKQ